LICRLCHFDDLGFHADFVDKDLNRRRKFGVVGPVSFGVKVRFVDHPTFRSDRESVSLVVVVDQIVPYQTPERSLIDKKAISNWHESPGGGKFMQ
jgi:hypothetical protein